VSGGFAVVQPGSKLSINAVEGYALEDFSLEVCAAINHSYRHAETDIIQAVRNQIGEAQKVAGGGGSEVDRAEAAIELEVWEMTIHEQLHGTTDTLQVLESLQAALR